MVEGEKSVLELVNSSLKTVEIFAREEWLKTHNSELNGITCHSASQADLERMSFFKSPSPVIAVAEQRTIVESEPTSKWIIALDGINDPGNLGTIIRIADWYGIDQVWCSNNTVDVYNPKVISSTMGSFTRVTVIYDELHERLAQPNQRLFFTLMAGESVSNISSEPGGIIVIGSEANGISDKVLALHHEAITIPRLGEAESLNAGVATAIICDRLVRG